MAKFANQMLKPTTSTSIGVGSIEMPGSGMRRAKICEAVFGSDATTLGTSAFRFELQRSTAAATGTGTTTLNALDPADLTAATTLIKSNLTAQGTNTAGAIQLTVPMSQQATFRWVANPGFEIVIPAVAVNGIHFNTPVAGNNLSAAIHVVVDEQ